MHGPNNRGLKTRRSVTKHFLFPDNPKLPQFLTIYRGSYRGNNRGTLVVNRNNVLLKLLGMTYQYAQELHPKLFQHKCA